MMAVEHSSVQASKPSRIHSVLASVLADLLTWLAAKKQRRIPPPALRFFTGSY